MPLAFQYPGLEGGKREKAPQRESSWAWVQSLCGPCLHLLAEDSVPVGTKEAPKGSEQGQPSPGLLFVIPDPDWSGFCSVCFTAFPEGSWSLCIWNPLIRVWGGWWGGATGPGQQWGEPAWSQCLEPAPTARLEPAPRAASAASLEPVPQPGSALELSQADLCCGLGGRSQAAGKGTRRCPGG